MTFAYLAARHIAAGVSADLTSGAAEAQSK
jgi:hypothetical protein